MTTLPRYLAWWSDGVTRVLHARGYSDALDLARQLGVAPGVTVVGVRVLR